MIAESKYIELLDEHAIEISLPNKFGYERIAMECSASFAKIVGFLPERIDDLKTAVSEACLNAMEHGNKNHPGTRVVINMQYGDNVFSITVMDLGGGIQKHPDYIENPDINLNIENLITPRGLGLFLNKQLVDQVEVSQMTDKE